MHQSKEHITKRTAQPNFCRLFCIGQKRSPGVKPRPTRRRLRLYQRGSSQENPRNLRFLGGVQGQSPCPWPNPSAILCSAPKARQQMRGPGGIIPPGGGSQGAAPPERGRTKENLRGTGSEVLKYLTCVKVRARRLTCERPFSGDKALSRRRRKRQPQRDSFRCCCLQ